jgi:hypothetical protein
VIVKNSGAPQHPEVFGKSPEGSATLLPCGISAGFTLS